MQLYFLIEVVFSVFPRPLKVAKSEYYLAPLYLLLHNACTVFDARYTCLKIFWVCGNGEAYQAPTSTRLLGITRSVPGLCGYQAKDYVYVIVIY